MDSEVVIGDCSALAVSRLAHHPFPPCNSRTAMTRWFRGGTEAERYLVLLIHALHGPRSTERTKAVISDLEQIGVVHAWHVLVAMSVRHRT